MDSILALGQNTLNPSAPRPGWLVSVLVTLAVSFLFLVSALSYPAIVFKGPLLEVLPAGLGIGLLSAGILGIGAALASSYPGSQAHPHSAPTIMIGVVVLEFIKTQPPGLPAPALLPTVLGLIATGTVLSGIALHVLGRYKLANMIRYVPLPVIAGILAGSGWLLLGNSVSAATGKPLASLLGPAAAAGSDWLKAGLALAVALALWGINLVKPRATNLSYVLLAVLLGFWLVAGLLDLSQAELLARGWLFPPMPQEALWTPAGHLQAMREADWLAIARMLPLLLIVVTINAFGFLVYNSGIEQATEQDIDLNWDARRLGTTNTLLGLLGGMPGFQNSSLSILVYRFGIPVRAIGVIAGLICLLTLAVGGGLFAYVPKILAGTMLAFLALSLMHEWLHAKTRMMSALDRGVVLLVFFSVIFLGFLQALAVGAVAGIVLFVVRYSGIPVARNVLTGTDTQSSTVRGEDARTRLYARGLEILILRLHGFIFFGSASRLVSLIGQRLQRTDQPPLRFLILDLRLVSGLDVSALASFAKLERYAQRAGYRLLISQVPAGIDALLRSGFPARPDNPCLHYFDQFDTALAWAEDQLLAEEGLQQETAYIPFDRQVQKVFGSQRSERVLRYFDVLELDSQAVVWQQGDASTDIYFIERGQVAVLLAMDDGSSMRLSLMGAGALIGEVAFYLGTRRTASIVTQTPTVLRRLTRERLERMQGEEPLLASALHQHMARALAFKLVETNRMVRALNQ